MPEPLQPHRRCLHLLRLSGCRGGRRICEALRAAGIEVWFDQSELRGGDSWDSQIKKQIHDCALFCR